MQKKIIALAIASAMTVPALAYAEATVYGQVNLSIDRVDDGAVATSNTTNQLNSNTSRLGLKGSEDLGGGLSAVWQLEGVLGPDTGTSSLFNRNNFLGLKSGDMGTVTLGRIDTAYKSATGRLDLFGDGIADYRGSQVNGATAASSFGSPMMGSLGGSPTHNTRVSNALNYTSPSFSGMTVAVSTVFGAEGTPTVPANDKKGSLISLAGMYEQGPIYATLAYQTAKAGDAGTGDLAEGGTVMGTGSLVDDKATAMKLGGSYSMDAITVNAVIEQAKYNENIGSVETKGTNMYLAGKFAISSTDAVKLAYTSRGETETSSVKNNDKASQVTLGYDHAMSKTTSVYALYSKVTSDGVGAADPSVLSVGMKHSF